MSDYYDLGTYSRAVSTGSPEAQLWFDRGLAWCYGFNHDEAVRCFERAAASDPDCAMAYWGIAYAAGPNYNKPWEAFDQVDLGQSLDRAHTAVQEALARKDQASAVEGALIEALQHRYPSKTPAEDLASWNDAYADAMRGVYQAFPDDLDVCALFAEAIMNRTPWKLWDLASATVAEDLASATVAEGAGTEEAMDEYVSDLLQGAEEEILARMLKSVGDRS